MNEEKEYRYDAFISYRHCELDKFVAQKLHRLLETYELPKSIKKKLNIKHKTFRRVFRDQEELPLTSNLEDPILEALENSKYLIVICSPRLKDSLWCKKEIETFKKLRGRKNIFCVLVEGEPSDSFPEEVLYDEEEIVLNNGKVKKERIMVEPLAADVRGKSKKQVLKKLKDEKLRLIAPMYNLNYDDLKQRHKIWRQRKIINYVIVIAILCLLFAIYSIAMFIKIELQQNTLAKNHALSLVSQSKDYLENDNRYEAVKLSYQALTDFEEISMPYTPEAEYALVDSLGVYDAGLSYKAVSQIKTDGVVDYIKSSPSNEYGAIYDGSEKITLFKTENLDVIAKYDVNDIYINEHSFSFVGDDKFAYINKKGNISLVNSKGKQIKEIKKDDSSYISLASDSGGKYLVYTNFKKLYIYDVLENKIIGTIASNDDYLKEIYFSKDSNYIFAETKEKNYDINKEEHMTIHIINTKEAKEVNNVTVNAGYISEIITKDNNAYFLLNNIIGTEFNVLIVSYDFINGNINWSKESAGAWGKFMTRSYPDGTNNIAVTNYDTINILNMADGNVVETFNTSSEIINIYSYLNKEMYLVFLSDGSVNYLNMEYRNSVEYKGKYEFNLSEYTNVVLATNGFLLIPKNENRVILYEEKANKKVENLDINLDYISDDSIPYSDYDKVKSDYKLKNKSLVTKMFYDTKKELLFVNYNNGDITIYNTKDKKLLKTLYNVGKIEHYFGKDKFGRIYIGDISYSYILDQNYDLVGRIKGLCKLEKDRVIVGESGKYYSIKIYSLDDLLKEARAYLKK